mmetsp:Transcript_12005/g.35426  ORF Transcript_12005/g.35426 Transcript_12005/m.35426 type:complete len:116 (-) Transcript_12005:809-1156(-)
MLCNASTLLAQSNFLLHASNALPFAVDSSHHCIYFLYPQPERIVCNLHAICVLLSTAGDVHALRSLAERAVHVLAQPCLCGTCAFTGLPHSVHSASVSSAAAQRLSPFRAQPKPF